MQREDKRPSLYVSVTNKTEADYVLKMIAINGILIVEPKIYADISVQRPNSSEWDFYTKIGSLDVVINILSQNTFDYFFPLITKAVKEAQYTHSVYSRD